MRASIPPAWRRPLERLASVTALAASVSCGGDPQATVPGLNDHILGLGDAGSIPTPTVEQVGSPYPYRVVPVRGSAPQAGHVVMTLNSASNPVEVDVNPVDQSYCGEIALVDPAAYDVAVLAASADGRSSPDTAHVKFVYDPNAPDLPSITLCHGQAPSR